MKGFLPVFFTLALVFAYSLASADVIINEIMVRGNSDGDDDLQWIELFNDDPQDRDVSGWILTNTPIQGGAKRRTLALPEGTLIPAGGYLLLINDLDDTKDHDGRCFTNQWSIPAGVEAIEYGGGFPQLDLGIYGDDIHLSQDGQTDVDAMWYGDGGEMGRERAAPDVPVSYSLGRNPNGQDSDDPATDFAKFSHPTPGASNQSAPVTERSTWSKIKLLFR